MRPRPATTTLLKELNERTVLEAIRSGHPISRAEISRRARISKPTVSLALRALLEAGLVREATYEPDTPKYGALFFEPVPEAALVLGLDIGARFLRGALCDLRGDVRAREDVELQGAAAPAVLDAAAKLKTRLLASTGIADERLDGVVVGVPGAVDPETGVVRLAENVPGLEGMAIGRDLSARIASPVRVENDVNLAALGEQWRGVGQGVDDFAVLSIGTGLGAGLVLRGALHHGHHGAAGEVDYAVAGSNAVQVDPCAKAVSRFAAGLAREQVLATTLTAPYEVGAIFAAARGNDPLGRAVVAEEARRIALHILPIAAVADVGLVILAGGIGVNGDLLLAPVRQLLSDALPYPPRLEVSSLGDAAVLTGALAVGLRAALDNVFERRNGNPAPAR